LISIVVISYGIAATVLERGRTAPASFSLPINLASPEKSTYNIGRGFAMTNILQIYSLVC
jgi:hypothetical protein